MKLLQFVILLVVVAGAVSCLSPPPTATPSPVPTPDAALEQRCITQFQIMNNEGRYSPDRMSDDDYVKAVEKLYSRPLLTRSSCANTWDRLDR